MATWSRLPIAATAFECFWPKRGAARKAALDRNTSVNQMVRDYLMVVVQEANQHQTAMANLEDVFRNYRVTVGRRTWTRDDLHER